MSCREMYMNMANSSMVLVILLMICFCGSVVGNRTKLYSVGGNDLSIPSAGDGICSSMVLPLNYVCEEHKVTTQDGYIVGVQRIPVGISGGSSGTRPPVLLQHGLVMDGITWLLLPPDQSLAFLLADNGFDVWIANTRGTQYSLGHTSLNPDDDAYWDWSWDELVVYELPALFQYVHDQTGQNLHYVGHSLGTLIALAAFSEQALLNMLNSAALLSPIAHLGQVTSPLGRVASDNYFPEALYQLGFREFDPKGVSGSRFLKLVCAQPGVDCADWLTSFTGPNCCLNSSTVDVFLDHEPQATSVKNLVHIAQMIRSGSIRKYDYGDGDGNIKHYGQPTPPAYDMTRIPTDTPLFLGYGGADALSDVSDMQLLLGDLSGHDEDKLVTLYTGNYAHADYVMAQNVKEAVYDRLVAFLKTLDT